MPETSPETVSKKARDTFNKGFVALERGQLDYAIDLLFSCVQMEPSFVQARKFLRAAEIQRFKQAKTGFFSKAGATMKALPKLGSAMALLQAGKADQAMAAAEELLKDDPLNLRYIMLLARSSDAAGLPDVGIQTLEIAREHFSDDADLVMLLGSLYRKVGRTKDAKNAFEKLVELRPNNMEALRALKDAMAVDSMSSDRWSDTAAKGGDFRGMMKDTKEAVLLEQESKAVKSERDSDALIAEMKGKIEKEPANINYRRALARLYAQKQMFDEGIDTLREAIAISPGDPELEQAVVALQSQKFERDIAQLEAAGDEAGAEAKRVEQAEFEFRSTDERVKRYPNDLKLRFEWGVMLLGRGMINEAIQQFQLSQKNLKYRPESLLNLGLCFRQKRQFDMAIDQLQMARKEIPVMTDTRKAVCYELGDLLESLDRKKEAAECYKEIYQVEIGYKDIAARVERIYQN